MKTILAIGAKVKYKYWFMGAEQGQRFATEWMDTKTGTIVSHRDNKWLIEHDDKSRTWVEEKNIVDLDWDYFKDNNQ